MPSRRKLQRKRTFNRRYIAQYGSNMIASIHPEDLWRTTVQPYATAGEMLEIQKALGLYPKLNLTLSGPASMQWALQQKAKQERELYHLRHRRARLTTTAILTAGTIINSGSSLATSILSTDTVAMKQQIAKGVTSASISGLHALGTITGNPYMFAAAYAVGLASDIFGQKIENNIQRKGDAKRLAYNFKNNDYNRFGNKVYNSQKNEWIAEDANKVKRRVLGQKTSV